MEYIRTALLRHHSNDPNLIVHIAQSFEFYFTYDGVDVCGTRVANEIEEVVDQLSETGKVTKLSVVGYSLGGLISRYCIGLLYQRGFFDGAGDKAHDDVSVQDTELQKTLSHDGNARRRARGIKPVTFTTFASPHVGVVALGTGLLSKAYNWISPYVLSYTSRQLCLTDSFFGKPLLQIMADPALPFYKALALFANRALYANIVNDHRTEWYTSYIAKTDPYSQFGANNVRGTYIENYGPVLIDPSQPLLFATQQQQDAPQLSFLSRKGKQVGRFCSMVFKITKVSLVVPVWAVLFLTNAAYQTVVSMWRKRSFVNSRVFKKFDEALNWRSIQSTESPVDETENYSAPFGLDEVLHEDADEALDSLMDAVNHSSNVDLVASGEVKVCLDIPGTSASSETSSAAEARNSTEIRPEGLHLNPTQHQIISNLNKLAWQKVPVHISKATHSHAAIIVRFENKLFEEGERVVDHWVKHVFVM